MTAKRQYDFVDLCKFRDKVDNQLNLNYNAGKIYTAYKGGLDLGVWMSRKANIDLNIIQFQTYDANDTEPKLLNQTMKADIGDIIFVDDIIDTGDTALECIKLIIRVEELTEEEYHRIKVVTSFITPIALAKVYDAFRGCEIILDLIKYNSDWIVFPSEPEYKQQQTQQQTIKRIPIKYIEDVDVIPTDGSGVPPDMIKERTMDRLRSGGLGMFARLAKEFDACVEGSITRQEMIDIISLDAPSLQPNSVVSKYAAGMWLIKYGDRGIIKRFYERSNGATLTVEVENVFNVLKL